MIGGIVLAAGGSRRFGSPKQLADLGGMPLLQHAVDAIVAVPAIGDVVVVLGAYADEIEPALDLGPARVVVCSDWAQGQSASLRAGLAALSGCEPVVITLGDEPGVTPQVIAAVLDRAGDAASARATYGGRPGHPVAVGAALLRRAEEISGDAGFRDLLGGAAVRTFEAGRLAHPLDIDTPSDLEKLHP